MRMINSDTSATTRRPTPTPPSTATAEEMMYAPASLLDHMKCPDRPSNPIVQQQSTSERQAASHESERARRLRPVFPSVVSCIPEFPDFLLTVPRGAAPETLLARQALEDICNPNSFKGLDPKAILEETGVMKEVWRPLVTSLHGALRTQAPCRLQYLDFDHVRLGMCASASLIERYAQGEVPEQLRTNEGIRNMLWLRLIRQLAVDCLEQGGSITSSRVAAELLGLPVELGKELISYAHKHNLVLIDHAPPHTITLTPHLIDLLDIPILSERFAQYLERNKRIAFARSSTRVQTLKQTTNAPNSTEKPAEPRPRKGGNELEPKTNHQLSSKLFPALCDSIKAVLKDNTGKWLPPVDLWRIIKKQGVVDAVSPGRVKQICNELRSSGFLRSKDGMFRVKEPPAQ